VHGRGAARSRRVLPRVRIGREQGPGVLSAVRSIGESRACGAHADPEGAKSWGNVPGALHAPGDVARGCRTFGEHPRLWVDDGRWDHTERPCTHLSR
jgi:hypothetical protein